MKKTINISLDLKRVTAQPASIPALVEGDTGNRFEITLTDAGAPVDVSGHKVVCVFSKVSDGTTVEQDTEDALVTLSSLGIELIGTPVEGDTITITETASELIAETTVALSTVTVTDLFRNTYPLTDVYVFTFHGRSWLYGEHSVKISGEHNNVIVIDPVKSGSFGNGKNNVELQLYNGTELVTTAQFNFDGRRGISNDTTIQAQEKFPILVQLIKRVEGIEKGTGFMLSEVYDPNGDGKVIAAEAADNAANSAKLGNQDPSYYATAESVARITPESIGAAVPSIAVSVELSGWTASGEGFAKTAAVTGVTPTSNVIVSPAAASFSAWADGVVRATELGTDSITFFAESDPGTVTANILIVG